MKLRAGEYNPRRRRWDGVIRIRSRRYYWRAGWFTRNWVLGARWDLAVDAWIWSVGPLVVLVGRA